MSPVAAGCASCGTYAGTRSGGFPPGPIGGIMIRLIKHEAVPNCGSFEVRFPDGRPSRYFYRELKDRATAWASDLRGVFEPVGACS